MENLGKDLLKSCEKLGQKGIVILIILGIFLMIVPGIILGKKEKKSTPDVAGDNQKNLTCQQTIATLQDLEEAMAQRAAKILGEIKGVGRISVAVSLDTGPEQDYLGNCTKQKTTVVEKTADGVFRETSENNEKTDYLLVQGKNEPILHKEKGPKVQGVLVVAEGAQQTKIKTQLSRAVESLFGLPAHRIIILPKESRE